MPPLRHLPCFKAIERARKVVMGVNRVDRSVIEALVRDSLLGDHLYDPSEPGVNDEPALLVAGDPDPGEDVLDEWARLVRVDVTPRRRQKGSGHTDVADVVVVVNVTCRGAALEETSEAVGQLAMAIAAKLDEQFAEDAATGHQLTMDRAEAKTDPDGDEQRLARTGYVTASGMATRYMADGTGDTVRKTF